MCTVISAPTGKVDVCKPSSILSLVKFACGMIPDHMIAEYLNNPIAACR